MERKIPNIGVASAKKGNGQRAREKSAKSRAKELDTFREEFGLDDDASWVDVEDARNKKQDKKRNNQEAAEIGREELVRRASRSPRTP